MPRPKPKAIGECCCPQGCGEVLQVYAYARRSDRPSMFKDKYFANCSTHGRVIDAARPDTQEHFLQRGKVWGADRPSTEPAEPVLALPQPAASRQEPTRSEPAQPAPNQEEEPPPAARRGWLRGWNLWDWWTEPTAPSD